MGQSQNKFIFSELPSDVIIMIILRLKPTKLAFEVIYDTKRLRMLPFFWRKKKEIHKLLFEDWKQHFLLMIKDTRILTIRIDKRFYFHGLILNDPYITTDINGKIVACYDAKINFSIKHTIELKIHVPRTWCYIMGTTNIMEATPEYDVTCNFNNLYVLKFEKSRIIANAYLV